ncbi:hypothetical protein CRG98_034120 [Punica granatum]|uniref:Reverse transcriptase Ty1/copia-type domain-containing protein n=1 Tax=Punica granatum TaxID=22663 RepID=A0A2I0INA1_PUNGR|nr:hypothetical protein CRG98_034120 [Punica granatum]
MEAKSDFAGLYLTQSKYINDILVRTSMLDCKPISSLVAASSQLSLHDGHSFEDPSLYRSVVGSLQYLPLTKPDIAFAVNQVCQFMHKPSVTHWLAVKRILRYLKDLSCPCVLYDPRFRVVLSTFNNRLKTLYGSICLNTTHGGLRRVFISEGITVEVNGAREVCLFYEPDLQTSDNRTATNEAKSGPLPNFQTRCMPLLPIHIIGPASVIAYRTRNPGARIETQSPTEGTIELLPEKCYSHNLHRKTRGVRLDEWRTRPGVERVWFEVLVKLEGERIKPVVVKKVRFSFTNELEAFEIGVYRPYSLDCIEISRAASKCLVTHPLDRCG